MTSFRFSRWTASSETSTNVSLLENSLRPLEGDLLTHSKLKFGGVVFQTCVCYEDERDRENTLRRGHTEDPPLMTRSKYAKIDRYKSFLPAASDRVSLRQKDETVRATCPFCQRSPKTTAVDPTIHPTSVRFDSQQSRCPVAPTSVDM